MTIDDELRALLDRDKIREVLARYCRGVDRGDRELLKSVYHEDAIDEHGMFTGRGVDFADYIVDYLKDIPCQHVIANHTCELRGDVAFTETYCISFSETGGVNATVYNRYVDRFEKRNGEWRVANRQVVDDWNRIDEVTATSPDAEMNKQQARRDRSDASYRLEGFLDPR